MSTPTVGDIVPVVFSNTKVPVCRAVVKRVNGRILDVTYLDGVFRGLRGVLRLPGWTRPVTRSA